MPGNQYFFKGTEKTNQLLVHHEECVLCTQLVIYGNQAKAFVSEFLDNQELLLKEQELWIIKQKIDMRIKISGDLTIFFKIKYTYKVDKNGVSSKKCQPYDNSQQETVSVEIEEEKISYSFLSKPQLDERTLFIFASTEQKELFKFEQYIKSIHWQNEFQVYIASTPATLEDITEASLSIYDWQVEAKKMFDHIKNDVEQLLMRIKQKVLTLHSEEIVKRVELRLDRVAEEKLKNRTEKGCRFM